MACLGALVHHTAMLAVTSKARLHLYCKQAASNAPRPQVVEPGAVEYSRMRVLDLSEEVARKGAQPVVDELAEREVSTPFELYRYPPVRGVIARLGDQDHAIVLVSHHVRPPLPRAHACALPLLGSVLLSS